MFNQSHLNHTAYVKNGDVVIGSLAAVRTDHILFGAKAGLAAKALPYDFLVIATGTSYGSDIKTEGTSIEHRRRSFQIEHQRIADEFTPIHDGFGFLAKLRARSHFPTEQVARGEMLHAMSPREAGSLGPFAGTWRSKEEEAGFHE